MRKLSMHVTIGAHNHRHNEVGEYRASLEHVDPGMMRHDVVLKEQTVASAYQELFGAAVDEYNARQKRADRRIDGAAGYYRKVMQDARGRGRRGSKTDKGKRPVYEAIVGIGNHDTFNPSDAENRELGNKVLSEFYARFRDEFPRLHVVQATIHNDEPDAGIHLQIAYVPWGDGYKRGLRRQQSLSKACENMGFSHMELADRMRKLLEEVCREFDVERMDMHDHGHHKPLRDFKAERREAERAAREAAQAGKDAASIAGESPSTEADELALLRAEVAALQRRNSALESLLDKATSAMQAMAQAVGMLVYDTGTKLAMPDMPPRPRKLLESVSGYAERWLRALGHGGKADEVRDEVRVSAGIREQMLGERGRGDVSR